MTEQKYCPLSRESGVRCASWCAWYDELEQQCAIMSITAELVALNEGVECMTTDQECEHLKGARNTFPPTH